MSSNSSGLDADSHKGLTFKVQSDRFPGFALECVRASQVDGLSRIPETVSQYRLNILDRIHVTVCALLHVRVQGEGVSKGVNGYSLALRGFVASQVTLFGEPFEQPVLGLGEMPGRRPAARGLSGAGKRSKKPCSIVIGSTKAPDVKNCRCNRGLAWSSIRFHIARMRR